MICTLYEKIKDTIINIKTYNQIIMESYISTDEIIDNIDVFDKGSVYIGLYQVIKFLFLKLFY